MKAVVLAAGRGTRLEELTFGKPKCLVNLNGRSLIDYQLDSLLQLDVSEVLIVVGYQADKLIAHVRRRYPDESRVKFIESADFATTNNMVSLSLTRDQVRGTPFVLMNADVVFEHSILADLVAATGSAVAVDVGRYQQESMKVVADGGRVRGMSKSIGREEALGCSIDLYRLDSVGSAVVFDEIDRILKSGRLNEWTEVALDQLARHGRLKLNVLDTARRPWYEIDHLGDLQAAEVLFGRHEMQWDRLDLAFLDMDGTLYLGKNDIPGTAGFVEELRRQIEHVYVLSNNSSRSHHHCVERLAEAGIRFDPSQVILSTDALTSFLVAEGIDSVFAIGTRDFRNILACRGIDPVATRPQAVVLGYDTELTYDKLACASLLLQDPELPYYATHVDRVCPTERGMIPDIGSIIALLETATGRRPTASFGKPDPRMVEPIFSQHGIDPGRSVFFGDRVETDYQMAHRCGARFVGLLSGDAQRVDYEVCNDLVIFPSVAEVFSASRL